MLQATAVLIEVTSTLTQDDEQRIAPAILKAISAMLDLLPIAYMVRIETTDQHTLVHISPQISPWEPSSQGPSDASQLRLSSES